MTWGTVMFVSRNGAWIVVRHDDGAAVVELLGDEGSVEVGERIKGNWDADGGEKAFTESLHRQIDIYIQGRYGSWEVATKNAMAWSGDNTR